MTSSISQRHRVASSVAPLLSFSWRLLLLLSLARLFLVVWQWQRVIDADMLQTVFLQGLRFDLVLLGLSLVIPTLVYAVLSWSRVLATVWRQFLTVYLPLCLAIAVFMELSTPPFVDQFDSRPNILFVEYLDHPKEVMATLWSAYQAELLITFFIVTLLAGWSARQLGKVIARVQPVSLLQAVVTTSVLLLLCLGMIRSTLDHRPVNPSTVALSSDPLANDLALNSTYTLLYAIYETRLESNGGFRYSDMRESDAVAEVRRAMYLDDTEFRSDDVPTLHRQHCNGPGTQAKNLVIIIEESLGAEFVGSLGGLPLTPNIDRLAAEGLWFTRLYATGTRSVRGLEAIVSGYTPTPARSVVKLPKSQRDFFTLAGLLAQHGYDTSFIYGGESQFDNMRRFFMNNGFARVIDEKDYDDPVYTGSWGVSDEDLFSRAHEEFESAGPAPFFSVVFTSSNHSPFQYPPGRIKPYDAQTNTVNNAVQYADFALGQFFDKAKASNYWDDTVFLVVADHNSRVYGDEVIPIERFHIPGLIVGGSIERRKIDTTASQIDLGPTLLSLIGIDSEHPMIGRDLTDPEMRAKPGHAIMQFNATQAYMEGDSVIVLQKNRPVQQFAFRDKHLVDNAAVDQGLANRALAHSVWSSVAYERGLYRLGAKDFGHN